ncbi:Serine/threonine-protein kinase Sgk1 [Mycena venus]|uniref:Serine/threonine-protein kinase Sgk1 n=1 Tax=Mycena venus TaxID=2733690 RepID=A0A8H6WRJ4_9AGAR|nr:Serine/threonine-protein kinase Sgk1 [Mycena venus]
MPPKTRSPTTPPTPTTPPRSLQTRALPRLWTLSSSFLSVVVRLAPFILYGRKATQRLYALKQIKKYGQAADIEQEQAILKAISALPDAPKSLLSLEASWTDAENFYLVTSWHQGKDLSTILVNGHRFAADRVKMYMAQLLLAVETLHDMKVIHRDIKPANVFLTKDGNVVLGDFGEEAPAGVFFDIDPEASSGSFFKLSGEDSTCTTQESCGTLHWMSPAQHAGTDYSFDADMWALGLLMFKMLTGRLPFGDEADNVVQVHAAYAFDSVEFRTEDGVDPLAQDLILSLLAKDGRRRPTVGQAKAHAYFRGVNWTAAARHTGPATWAPRKGFVPKEARKTPLTTGVTYEDCQDELPGPVKSFVLKVASIFRCTGKTKTKATAEVPARVPAQSLAKFEVKLTFYGISLGSPAKEKNEQRVMGADTQICGSDSIGAKASSSSPAFISWVRLFFKPKPAARAPRSCQVKACTPRTYITTRLRLAAAPTSRSAGRRKWTLVVGFGHSSAARPHRQGSGSTGPKAAGAADSPLQGGRYLEL